MKTNLQSRKAGAFTLIEMVGVLAVIALLAAILVPKVFSAINNARYANTVSSMNAVKTAAVDYFGKYGRFGTTNGAVAAVPIADWDNILITENFLERPADSRLGTNTTVKVVAASSATVGETYLFKLNGTDAILTGSKVVLATIEGVERNDANELSQRIDGKDLSVTSGADSVGRVVYADTDPTTVYIYLVHR